MAVSFHPELRVLIAEAHYLDRKGFTIPPLALQVALQQGEYRAWTESLERLLVLFYTVRVAQVGSLFGFLSCGVLGAVSVAGCLPRRCNHTLCT